MEWKFEKKNSHRRTSKARKQKFKQSIHKYMSYFMKEKVEYIIVLAACVKTLFIFCQEIRKQKAFIFMKWLGKSLFVILHSQEQGKTILALQCPGGGGGG